LTLTKCLDPEAFIEVGLRATPAKEKTKIKTPISNEESSPDKDKAIEGLIHDLEKAKKE